MQALWTEARSRFGAGGPYLYGTFSNADAYFAPVVFRFNTYGVKCSPVVASYVKAMLAHPSMQQWIADSRAEPQVVDHEEPEFIYCRSRRKSATCNDHKMTIDIWQAQIKGSRGAGGKICIRGSGSKSFCAPPVIQGRVDA